MLEKQERMKDYNYFSHLILKIVNMKLFCIAFVNTLNLVNWYATIIHKTTEHYNTLQTDV